MVTVHDPKVLSIYKMLISALNNKEQQLYTIQDDYLNLDPQNKFESIIAAIDNNMKKFNLAISIGIITGLKMKLALDYKSRATSLIFKLDELGNIVSLTARSLRLITSNFNDQQNTLLGCYLALIFLLSIISGAPRIRNDLSTTVQLIRLVRRLGDCIDHNSLFRGRMKANLLLGSKRFAAGTATYMFLSLFGCSYRQVEWSHLAQAVVTTRNQFL